MNRAFIEAVAHYNNDLIAY